MQDNFIQFSMAISRLNKQVQQLKTNGMQALGLKAVHTVCMYQMLERPDGMSFSEVQEACDLDQALVSRILSKLTAIGMVVKEGEPGRYNARYRLTRTGQQVAVRIRDVVAGIQVCADAGIDPEELAVFYKVLNQLQSNLDSLEAPFLEQLLLNSGNGDE